MFGKKVNNTRVLSVTWKIVLIFSLFLFLSNFSTNMVNLMLNRGEQFKLLRQLLVKDLSDMQTYSSNQFEIFQFDKDERASIKSLESKGLSQINNSKAVVLGIKPNGTIYFQSSGKKVKRVDTFSDTKTLKRLVDKLKNKKDQDNVNFTFNREAYTGVYKYNSKWDIFIVRGEELDEFNDATFWVMVKVTGLIVLITFLMVVVGVKVLSHILRFINIITSSIMKMISNQQMGLIDMEGATNDDISYMGIAFNSLSASVDNLVNIFKKFANQDIVNKAYNEREVKLEGSTKELTIIFSDIKSFTFITETLGPDIIKLLNMHYDRAIREIIKYEGIIGSIIGDALLAVYGAIDNEKNKSYQAILSAYRLHDVTDSLRKEMTEIKNDIQKKSGKKLSTVENRVYKACLLEIGVGIDGGDVFYGTLGSNVRMTNTVIGDNVNAASRLEGLTRIYKIPVIVSDFVKDDIEKNLDDHGVLFYEIDTVLVKGKTTGKKIYWPILEKDHTPTLKKYMKHFSTGLELYYEGDWTLAKQHFAKVKLPVAEVFIERTKGKAPKKWNGIWEMTTK